MSEKILMLEGEKEIVAELEKGLLDLGMLSIELDVHDDELASTAEVVFKTDEKMCRSSFENEEEDKFKIDPLGIIGTIVALIGSKNLVTMIVTVINRHKEEGSIELDENGNILKVNFKNIKPEKVPKMLSEIAEVVRKEEK